MEKLKNSTKQFSRKNFYTEAPDDQFYKKLLFLSFQLLIVSGNRVRLLKRRALRFLDQAKRDLDDGYYDIGAFHVEQALQLYIKAVIFELFGKEYEGHGIRELISYLSKLLKENGYEDLAKKINELIAEYRQQLIAIEDAYIDSRYENIEYENEDLKPLIEVAEIMIKFLEEVVKIVKLG